jgi:protein TonB
VRNLTIIVSLLVHVVVFGYALRVSEKKKGRIATAVVVEKKEKKPEPPKPKPKPAPPPKVEPKAAPEPLKNAPSHAPETAPAPVETHMTFDNSNAPGIDVGPKGPAQPKSTQPGGQKRTEPVKAKEKVLGGSTVKGNPEEDNCTEAPSKPQPITRATDIEYTQDARANGVEGRLVLRVIVGADGSVIDVQVQSSVDGALDAAAIAAVKTWTFKPSMRCGKPMSGGVFTLARRFELGD